MSVRGAKQDARQYLVRPDRLVFAIALFVAGYALWSELDYARFESDGARVEAQIERIGSIRSGRRIRHYLYYRYDFGGKTYRFDDRDDRDRLEELYTATWNAFVDPEAPLKVGATIGLLIDRSHPAHHRPDRARLQHAWIVHLRTLLALVFLAGVGAFLFVRQRKQAHARAEPAPRSYVSSRRSGASLELRLELDVPWPEGGAAGQGASSNPALDALRAKMPAREQPAAGGPLATIRVALELMPREDRTLDSVHVELASRDAARDIHTLARRLRVRKGQAESLSIELSAPATLLELRVVVSETPSKTFSHTFTP